MTNTILLKDFSTLSQDISPKIYMPHVAKLSSLQALAHRGSCILRRSTYGYLADAAVNVEAVILESAHDE